MLVVGISGSDQWHVGSSSGQRGEFYIILHRQLPPQASRKADPPQGWLQAKLFPTTYEDLGESGGGA